jgi:site-specific recombinase XerD
MNRSERLQGCVLISKPSLNRLNQKERIRLKEHRKPYIKWLNHRGRDPEALKGYAPDTAKMYAAITETWARWVWDREGFTLLFNHNHADDYLEYQIIDEENSRTHCSNVKLALRTYFEWRDDKDQWKPSIKIKSQSKPQQPKEVLSRSERRKLREASLEYGSLPAYHSLEPNERSEWKVYLARRFGKPTNEVGPDDFKRANGFKYPTITFASLDAGLRPVEVGRAKTYWVNTDKGVLEIPADEAAKSDQNWVVSLTDETTQFLVEWLEERKMYEKYDGTEQLWLTRHGNPYGSSSLKNLLTNLCELAGIKRDMSWYTIRHSVGTHMADERGLEAARSQLRHKNVETTTKYDNVSVEDRRDALDKMG